MKTQKKRALWSALLLLGVAGAANAQAELNRCQQADGSITFQQAPCPLAELVLPEPAQPAVAAPPAPPVAKPAPAAAAAPPPKPVERSVVTPERVAIPAPLAGGDTPQEDGFVKPSKRKRDILELTAQFERCRVDMPGFAEKASPVYAAWQRRHQAVIAEYNKLLMAKVRAARRGEATLPLRLCTEEWLRAEIEPLSRMPDARFQTVEKTWQVFMGALMTGDRAALLSALSGKAEARWKERADRLSDEDMRRIGGSIRALKVQWGDDYEKEGLVADNDNRVTGISFRNVNEEWKITDLGSATTIAQPAVPQAQPPKAE